jgi:hypothetical protein
MPDGTAERVAHLVKLFHGDILAAGVTVDLISVATDGDDPPLMLNGYPCAATVRATSVKDRTKGHADIEITIDEAQWLTMTDAQKDALLDHELEHVELVIKPKTGRVKLDSHGRPKIKMRKHDVQFGWFHSIAERHGIASGECQQAASLFLDGRQTFFAFIGNEGKVKTLTEAKATT